MNSNRALNAVCGVAGAMLLSGAAAIMAQNTTSPSATDKKFVHAALHGGTAEVQLGQLAVQKGNSDDVKQFGQKMIDDHTKMCDEMRELAKKEGIRISAGSTEKVKALEKKLKAMSGNSFDRAYIAAMVKDHRQDLADFKKEANSGNDTAIKDAASQGAQVISQHLKLIEGIAQKHNVSIGETGQ